MTLRIGYIVHDLNDAAVAKRCAMMLRGGAVVQLAGFRRANAPSQVQGISPVELGETADGALAQRAMAVMRNVTLPAKISEAMHGSDILIARNLESLAIAQRIADGRPVIYECLDIHRSLLNDGFAGKIIRGIEAKLLANTKAIITSSPGFIREYFDHRPIGDAEIKLIENKILLDPGETAALLAPQAKPAGPPWVIGWFGMLRCKRTLAELTEVAAKLNGAVQIHIAGKPSPAELPDFETQVAAAPHFHYSGPYTPAQLPELYAACHFAWAIDWFEEGQNSEWLLPNRLYEATAHATVPIVLKRHEVGRWLAKRDAGLQIVETTELQSVFASLDAAGYAALQGQVSTISPNAIIMGDAECREFTAWLEELA
ncbi:glycosyltransferase family protein [Altererythrobacter lutimaris]|uniref:Glycosyl transferase family 1 n=1 Tax=Altererythrobacter lutimaris TaxID=2743979 RepID=A0A850H7Y0_9SPHN|nr:hypothetical protein [Altererythrobacter lutimaris]NVE93345.1 hypothetical protein [Altererythrobacter lutimaris]